MLIELDRILLEVYNPDIGKSKIEQTADEIMTEVRGKVGNKEIISRINQSAETVQIKASKINLVGAVDANSIQANAITADKFRANETITKKLNATNLHVSGSSTFDGIITARKGGTIGGWEIDDTRILSEYIDTEDNNKTKYTKLQNGAWGYAIAAGSENKADATGSPFYVKHNGEMHASKGVIAGWTIEKNRIYSKGSNGNYTKLQSSEGFNHALVVGAHGLDNSTDAPFYVTHAGKLYANNAEITGKITAGSGDIGGWTLSKTRLKGGEFGSGVAIIQPPMEGRTYIIAVGDSKDITETNFSACDFRVTKAGKLYANNAEISGKITASGGEIDGWTIDNGRLIAQGSDGLYTKLQSTKGWTHALVVGAPNKNDSDGAPFYVTHAGKLYATNAQLSGSITAESFTAYSYENDERVGRLRLEGNGIVLKSLVEDHDYSISAKNYSGSESISIFPSGISGYNGGSTGDIFFQGNAWETYEGFLAKNLELSQYISVGTRIYMANGMGIRGMLNGRVFDSDDAVSNSTVIAYVDTNNRTILGSAANSYATEVRSPTSIYFKCNSGTSDTGVYSIRFQHAEDGSTYFRPCSPNVINLGGPNNPWSNVYMTDLRSQGALYLKCNGATADDDNRYVIGFARVNFGTTDSPTYYGCLRSKLDNYTVLGSSGYRFRNVYSTNGVSTTSDRNRKHNIKELDDKYIQLFDKLQPVSYVLNDGGERTHVGFISQDVESAMNEIGMTSMDFAGFCKDIIADDDGNAILDENGNEQEYYSLRYSEFISINTAKIKQLEKLLFDYQQEINNQKERIEQLEQMINQ